MPSTVTDADVPGEAAAVARRYRRVERPVSGGLALLGGLVATLALFVLPFAAALAVLIGVVVLLRMPIVRTAGTYRLTTDVPPGAVRDAFEGPTPPPLVFYWGLADTVRTTAESARYEVSYLFGLRSTVVVCEHRVRTGGGTDRTDGGVDDAADVELVVTVDGSPWATYDVSVAGDEDGATVDVAYRSERRFGLRRLPQRLVARRYRDEALAAQGYTVASDDGGLTV